MLQWWKNSFDVGCGCWSRFLWRTLQLPNCKGTPDRAILYQGWIWTGWLKLQKLFPQTIDSTDWWLWLKKWLLCLLVECYMGSLIECPLVPECKGCAKRPGEVFLERIFLVKIISTLFLWYVSIGGFKWCSLSLCGNLFMLLTILQNLR